MLQLESSLLQASFTLTLHSGSSPSQSPSSELKCMWAGSIFMKHLITLTLKFTVAGWQYTCTCTMHNALMLVWGYEAQVRPNDQPSRLGLCLHCLIVPRACIGVRTWGWEGTHAHPNINLCATHLLLHMDKVLHASCLLTAGSGFY